MDKSGEGFFNIEIGFIDRGVELKEGGPSFGCLTENLNSYKKGKSCR